MPITNGDVLKCTVKWLLPDGVQALNVFHAEYIGSDPIFEPTVVAHWEDYINSIIGPYQGSVPPGVSVDEAVVHRLVDPGPPPLWEVVGFFTPTFNPTNINEMLPHGCCALLTADLDGPGRGTAKKFFPGLNEGATIGSTIIPAVITVLDQMRVAWESNFGVPTSQEFEPGTWTEKRGLRKFVRTKTNPLVAYQRRRKPGVGM